MYLARVVVGSKPQVYPLIGALYFPRAWRFMSYERGAAAIAETKAGAIREAERYLLRRIAATEYRLAAGVGGGNINHYYDSNVGSFSHGG